MENPGAGVNVRRTAGSCGLGRRGGRRKEFRFGQDQGCQNLNHQALKRVVFLQKEIFVEKINVNSSKQNMCYNVITIGTYTK